MVARQAHNLKVAGSNPASAIALSGAFIPIDRASERARLLIGDW